MSWLATANVESLSKEQLLEQWCEYPRGYVPMAYRSPDLLCHHFLRDWAGGEFWDEKDMKFHRYRGTLDDIIPALVKCVEKVADEGGRQLLKEKLQLSNYTYQPRVSDPLFSPPCLLTADAVEWPSEPARMISVVKELGLKMIDAVLGDVDKENLLRMITYEKSPEKINGA
jgi:hypothetical protein